jgi:hypothetical protein
MYSSSGSHASGMAGTLLLMLCDMRVLLFMSEVLKLLSSVFARSRHRPLPNSEVERNGNRAADGVADCVDGNAVLQKQAHQNGGGLRVLLERRSKLAGDVEEDFGQLAGRKPSEDRMVTNAFMLEGDGFVPAAGGEVPATGLRRVPGSVT